MTTSPPHHVGATFTSPQHELYLTLQVLSTRLRDETEHLLKTAGLSLTQFNILRILRGAGPRSLTCGEIGTQLITKDSDVTRLLDRMENLGLVERVRSDQDRRVVLTRISDKALGLLATLDQPLATLHQQQFAHLRPDRLQQLLELLKEALI